MFLIRWIQREIFWHRFTHGRCVKCGKNRPITGATSCIVCIERARRG